MAGKQSGKKCQRHVPATSYRDLTTPPRVILVNSTLSLYIGALINYAPIKRSVSILIDKEKKCYEKDLWREWRQLHYFP
jgi:hypothetical protein